ncbi:hypothetical protein [Sandaracinus amylolyticus]|uniref:Rhs-family protein n=1 Tax=Sandaracinus amylolyticus TaxID=927083 RepID=A0A0F6W803_9BACT|nr:hypothetical protein [Sandaracinus amylolyticus]AKF09761.1 hypothetical protein DB32_006910 [Sandaracinus amylolyticus]
MTTTRALVIVSLVAAGCGGAASAPTHDRGELACAPARACDETADAWPSTDAYRGWAPFDEREVPASIVEPVPPLPVCAVESGSQVLRWTRDARGLPASYEQVEHGEVQLRVRWEHDASGMLVRETVERELVPVHVQGDGDRGPTFVDGRPERVTTWQRDGATLREAIDEDGDGTIDREIVRTLDARGATRSETRVRCGGSTRAGSELRTWERDAQGRVIAERCDAEGARWSKRTIHGEHGPSRMAYERRDEFGARALEHQWTYDGAGRLVREGFDADGDGALDVWREHEITLDEHGRVAALRTVPHGDGRRAVEHRWAYDAEGRRVDHVIVEGASTSSVPRGYDARGRLATTLAATTLRYECE